jgi:tRNA(Ile)-lysidine synthase
MTAPISSFRTIANAISAVLCDSEPDGVLVALSGGPDSVLMLRAAIARRDNTGQAVAAAHFHHGLRGDDADADLKFCRDLCTTFNVPFHSTTAPGDSASDEAHLRQMRRSYLLSVLDEHKELAVCATGHHADDQAETVLMRLFRGSGLDGLSGIHPRSGRLIHPMLSLDRVTILAELSQLGQDYRLDATNLTGNNLRARMRRELQPVLNDLFGAGGLQGPIRAAELLQRDAEALNQQADDLRRAWRSAGLADHELPVSELCKLPSALSARSIRRIVTGNRSTVCPLEASHIDSLRQWLATGQSGSQQTLPGGWTAERHFDILSIHRNDDREPEAPLLRLSVRDATQDELLSVSPEAGWDHRNSPWRLTLPQAILKGELHLRRWNEGDRLRPFGMTGHKKVSDLMREAQVPTNQRDRIAVVEDDDGPFWLVGITRDERTRLLPTTTRGLTLLVESLER